MSNGDIIRAWKDQAYRKTIDAAELAAVPANPAGTIEISDEDLGKVSGGMRPRGGVTEAGTDCTPMCTTFPICTAHTCSPSSC